MTLDTKGRQTPSRRLLLGGLGAAAAATLVAPNDAMAEYQCHRAFDGNRCIAQVPEDELQLHYQEQDKSQWCWAACISMLFSYYGHTVSQERIVEEAYGNRDINMPAQNLTMSYAMNRDWVSDEGVEFSSRVTRAMDLSVGVQTIDNSYIVGRLERDQPVILGAAGHAVLLTRLEYYGESPPRIYGGRVLDPWPGQGLRELREDERYPAYRGGSLYYIVAIRVF